MLHSLKAKFTFAFGTLIVVLFAALGAFLIDAKSLEIAGDISSSTQSFALFTVRQIVESYEQYLEPGSFLPFTREVRGLLRRNKEITGLSLMNYGGIVLYDSIAEKSERYDGSLRTVDDQDTLDRVQSNSLSLSLDDGRILYVKVNEDQTIDFVDRNEDEVKTLNSRDRIVDIIVPFKNAYAVSYLVSYQTLEDRLASSKMQIISAAMIGILLALMLSFIMSASITNPLKELKAGAIKIAGGNFGARVKVKTKDEVGVLATTFNKMAEDLSKSTEAMLYQERVVKELELATQIQNGLLPDGKVSFGTLDVAGGLVPATEIGGDAFDYIEMNDGRYLIYLGDVTGHGVAAGIVSSITNAILYGMRDKGDLKLIVKQLNEVIRKKTSMKVFVTMALTLWDETNATISYINAGHPPVLYYDAAKKKVVEITLPGMALGLAEDVEILMRIQDIILSPGDILVMYSDGIPEAVNGKNVQYGMQRLKRIVQDAANDLYTSDGVKNAILADVVEHIAGHEHMDDMTVVVLKRMTGSKSQFPEQEI